MPARKPKDDDLAMREDAGTAIVKTEAEVIEALGIPVGFVDVADPGEIMAGILAEIASAGSVEAALKLGSVEGLQDYTGHELTFLDFKYQPSEYDPMGWPFVVIRAADEQGEVHNLTSGAKQVVTMLALARKTGELPFRARVEVVGFTTPEGEARTATKLVSI